MQIFYVKHLSCTVCTIKNYHFFVQILLLGTVMLRSVFCRVAYAIHSVLGFDWLMLFLHPHIHRETVNRAFRILVQLLSDQGLLSKFRDGNLGCRWLKEAQGYLFELVPQMNQHFHLKFHSILSPGREQGWKELKSFCSLPGFCLLNNLLPKHKDSPQVYLLVIALLLGKPVSDVPNNAPFDLESLDSVFQMSSMEHKGKMNICMDAVYILLTITRVLLHPVSVTRSFTVLPNTVHYGIYSCFSATT